MLFRRRQDPTISERIRVALWPRRSWARSSKYVQHRVWRLHATPHRIAIGFAAGVLVSFLPLVGFHFLAGGILAFMLGGSIIASAFGTFVGNPLTFPFIWVGGYKLGNLLLGSEGEFSANTLMSGLKTLWAGIHEFSADVLFGAFQILWPFLKPMTVGGFPLGLVAATVFYFVVLEAVKTYQSRRNPYAVAGAENSEVEREQKNGGGQ